MRALNAQEKNAIRPYVIGFGLSLGITIIAFVAALVQIETEGRAYDAFWLVAGLVGLAIVQLAVQMLFFFHLGHETRPRLNTVSFLFMLMVVGIIGIGSLWIMYNLDDNMMPNVEEYIINDEGFDPR